MANCPYCHKYFPKKALAVEHIYKLHSAELQQSGMDAPQALYFSTHGTLHGKCMACGKPTEWSTKLGKPYKMCGDPACRQKLRDAALKNHIKVYGKATLLNDMEHQKEMQKHRPTAGKYQFKDGGYVDYLSKPEKNFLQFCDKIMDFTSNMIQNSPETFVYYDPVTKTNRQYDPDFYLPDYNLIVEIKDGGSHTNTNPAFVKETKYKVALKDEVMRNQTKYNYIKITDQSYGPFVELLYRIIDEDYDSNTKQVSTKNKKKYVITEAACKEANETDDPIVDMDEPMTGEAYLIIGRKGGEVACVGLSETEKLQRIYLNDFTSMNLRETNPNDPALWNADITIFKYAGDKELMKDFFATVIKLALSNSKNAIWDIIQMMSKFGIFYTDKEGMKNNDHKKMDFIKTNKKMEKKGGEES